jgi:hypothetical protein
MSEMNLKQAQNEVAVEGVFQELDIHEGVTRPGRDGKTKEYIRGTVTVSVEQQVGKELEIEEIPISFFATKFKNAGGLNPAYENINALRTMKRRSTDGDEADFIRLSSFGYIGENTFVSRTTGQLINYWNINGSFFSKVIGTPNPRAMFKVKIVVRSIEDEIKDDVPTGRLKIKGIIVQYGGRADVVEFVVEDKQAAAHIMKRFSEQDTIIVAGYVRVTMVTVAGNKETGAGGDMIGEDLDFSPSTSSRRRELVITSVSPNPLDGDDAYDIADIGAALNARKEKQDKQIADFTATASKPAATRGW